MSAGTTYLLIGLLLTVMCCAVSAASKRPGSAWNYYHFDGSGFAAGRSLDNSRFLAVRDRMMPVVVDSTTLVTETSLPDGTGAIAGICYLRSSGGRQISGSASVPASGVTVTITSDKGVALSIRTDESGFFVAVLDAGGYTVSHGAFNSRVTVEKGTTILVPLRAGKRMVD